MNPNDPAFPPTEHGFETGQAGLTKREYFAAVAMQGQLASMTNAEVVKAWQISGVPYEWCANSAVKFADSLIAELSK